MEKYQFCKVINEAIYISYFAKLIIFIYWSEIGESIVLLKENFIHIKYLEIF